MTTLCRHNVDDLTRRQFQNKCNKERLAEYYAKRPNLTMSEAFDVYNRIKKFMYSNCGMLEVGKGKLTFEDFLETKHMRGRVVHD